MDFIKKFCTGVIATAGGFLGFVVIAGLFIAGGALATFIGGVVTAVAVIGFIGYLLYEWMNQ